jgi:ParB-like chromosome segregation protein Spo0J
MSSSRSTSDQEKDDNHTPQASPPPPNDLAVLEAALIENKAGPKLNRVDEARACATLIKALGLTHSQMAERIGRSRGTVTAMMRMLTMSEEILGYLERGELGFAQSATLLTVKDLQLRGEFARMAVERGWASGELAAHVRRNKNNPEPDRDETALAVAKAWGDLLSVEVDVRPEVFGEMSVKLNFTSATAALDLAAEILNTKVRSR